MQAYLRSSVFLWRARGGERSQRPERRSGRKQAPRLQTGRCWTKLSRMYAKQQQKTCALWLAACLHGCTSESFGLHPLLEWQGAQAQCACKHHALRIILPLINCRARSPDSNSCVPAHALSAPHRMGSPSISCTQKREASSEVLGAMNKLKEAGTVPKCVSEPCPLRIEQCSQAAATRCAGH